MSYPWQSLLFLTAFPTKLYYEKTLSSALILPKDTSHGMQKLYLFLLSARHILEYTFFIMLSYFLRK